MSQRTGADGPVDYRQWTGPGGFAAGTFDGMVMSSDALRLGQPVEVVGYADPFGDEGEVAFEKGCWSSPVVRMPAGFVELVASWNARTPPGSWLEVSLRVWQQGAAPTASMGDFVLGCWAEDTGTIHRTSVPDQASRLAHVDCDVLVASPGTRLGAWQVTVSCHRRLGSASSPTVAMVGAMTSPEVPRDSPVGLSPPGRAAAGRMTLDVPRYSQMLHRGLHVEFGGGGEAWCSAASTAMVLDYWKRGPGPADSSWMDESRPDGAVTRAAAQTYDYAYRGTGNWAFNTAYAATLGLVAAVTRLHSLAEAEHFIEAGIPLVASVSFAVGELAGAGYPTDGHLLVIVGFTISGDVVVNDPASHLIASNDEVRVVYDRTEFERVWLTGSGGLVYVVRPADVPLPPTPAGTAPHW